jgi:hypothetical protein
MFCFFSRVYFHHLTKTLTTIDLQYIDIGDQGIRDLSDFLQYNKVGYQILNH